MKAPDNLHQPSPAATWQAGWLRGVRHVPSPNFGPRPPEALIDLIVLHSISLPPGQYGGGGIEALFTNRLDCNAHPYFQTLRGLAVSAHFVIAREGAVSQFVSADDRAWHAGRSAYRGRSECNDDSIGIELEGLEGEAFEPVQYAALAALCQVIAQQYPIGHVAGHEHVAHGRKQDPGPGFDWARLRSLLGPFAWTFPEGVLAPTGPQSHGPHREIP